jgi:hypothetical protein
LTFAANIFIIQPYMTIPRGESEQGHGVGNPNIQPGVRPATQAFLEAARGTDAYQQLDPRRRHLIDDYFGTPVRLRDLRPVADVRSVNSVKNLIQSGLVTLWEKLPPTLQAVHPKEAVIFLKSKGQGRRHTGETPRRMSEKRLDQPVRRSPEHQQRLYEAYKSEKFRRRVSEAQTRSRAREREELATPAEAEDPHIPPGVRPATHAFLEAVRGTEAYQRLDERRRALIDAYFGSSASLQDLVPQAQVRHAEYVRKLVRTGLTVRWENAPVGLQELYPAEKVVQLKNRLSISQSRENREKISAARNRKSQQRQQEPADATDQLEAPVRQVETTVVSQADLVAAADVRKLTLGKGWSLVDAADLVRQGYTVEHAAQSTGFNADGGRENSKPLTLMLATST